LRFLVGSPISDFSAASIGSTPAEVTCEDKAISTLRFEDGSLGTVHYFANGGRVFARERIEAFAANGVLQLDNLKRLNGYGWKGFRSQRLLRQDKGQAACVAAFLQSVRSGETCPIPYGELMEVARVSIEVAQALHR
jgi:predicted dehydrogenase